MDTTTISEKLLSGLKEDQANAVKSSANKLLVVAGAGSGKTEVMARRIAWWVGVEGVPKDSIIAFTFTEKAAAEMKLRVRKWIGEITPSGKEVNLRGMYVGTIHGYCLAKIREYWPDAYHNYDILDEAARSALVLREFYGLLELDKLRKALNESQSETLKQFFQTYDQLHEHNRFDIALPKSTPPIELGEVERKWCNDAKLITGTGESVAALAFANSAAKYYAYLRCRRFLDFSTSQTEFIRNLSASAYVLESMSNANVHLVIDEVQDINPVQLNIINLISCHGGKLTAVGDHRQSIYGFRGAKVELIGRMWNEFNSDKNSDVIDLEHNFRSTPRIIEIANKWANTITPAGGMKTPAMLHGKIDRTDSHPSHVAITKFTERKDEASWIARAIRALVPNDKHGAEHDKGEGQVRGVALSDIAILVRSSTDVRTYMTALEREGIPCIVRAGPDLFSQPEVLLLLSAISISAGIKEYFGSQYSNRSLPNRIQESLDCDPFPEDVFSSASEKVRSKGLNFLKDAERRLLFVARALHDRIKHNRVFSEDEIQHLETTKLKRFLTRKSSHRRVFPQEIFHWMIAEAHIHEWDNGSSIGEAAIFHLGAFSKLVTSLETPGWTSTSDYEWQVIGLCQYGSEGGRAPEQPLIVQPDAVTISTIHAVKGLEFAAVFLADVCARRFPSSQARKKVSLPLDGNIVNEIEVDDLSDNENVDGERRLMYVALTRAERFLVVSYSGKQNSKFIKPIQSMVGRSGGVVSEDPESLLDDIRHAPLEYKREIQLSTSFSDMRYYLGCPHDFYLRKVIGFSPTIDQAFGYGRGVHNLMRAIHNNPKKWADLAMQDDTLKFELSALAEQGLFYLRYTTGEPAANMRKKGVRIAASYVKDFAHELENLTFEPEKEFETVIDYEDNSGSVMISGAIDIVRRDDPPKVSLIDFKSGSPNSVSSEQLDEEEMCLQVGIYAIAAKKELEYEPDRGIVRYLDVDRKFGNNSHLEVPLSEEAIKDAKKSVIQTATAIRDREFREGPKKPGYDGRQRCFSCDFLGFCGMPEAKKAKKVKY
ncbi:ATP-dependent helicase [Teredinibacter turnerae]|uniref:ATP-dependent helicase n=1 Tax=Teredinibacter turnerae TaxID=2426 RepID=UPI0005F844D0|nr:ATP-dependent DNA helicase [Teredinibacter turnerae]